MKKTLISLAVAVSAAISGSAMAAWTTDGTGGIFKFGGTLIWEGVGTPWEVAIGDAVNSLDADVDKGQKDVSIAVKNTIPLLGIRTKSNDLFSGRTAIAPQIKYGADGKALDVDSFNNSVAKLTLDVTSQEKNDLIGSLTTDVFAQGVMRTDTGGNYWVKSPTSGDVFFGGLPKTSGQVSTSDRAAVLMPSIKEHFPDPGTVTSSAIVAFSGFKSDEHYNGYYYSVIESGKNISIHLTNPIDDSVRWKASLPITVSYQ